MKLPRVKTLEFTYSHYRSELSTPLLRAFCPSLERLDIQFTSYGCEENVGKPLAELAACTSLKLLNISTYRGDMVSGFTAVSGSLSQVASIALREVHLAIIHRTTGLEILNSPYWIAIVDALLLPKFAAIERLTLDLSHLVDPSTFEKVIKRQLEPLDERDALFFILSKY